MKKRQRGKSRAVIAIPVILLCVCAVLLSTKPAGMRVEAASPVSVAIPETIAAAEGTSVETISRQAQALSLYNKNPDENIPFRMTNMFPGDSKTQYYRVSVSYTGTVTVSFRAVPEEDGDKLGDALKAKVLLMNTGQVLYEGSIAGMPQLDHVLNAGSEERTEELFYEITIGLGTDAGNEYQNQSLNADLCWWAEGADRPDEPVKPSEPEEGGEPDEPDEPTKPSKPDAGESEDSAGDEEGDDSQGGSLIDPTGTGDDSRLMMWLVVFGVALASMIVVLAKCGRREQIMGTGIPESDGGR